MVERLEKQKHPGMPKMVYSVLGTGAIAISYALGTLGGADLTGPDVDNNKPSYKEQTANLNPPLNSLRPCPDVSPIDEWLTQAEAIKVIKDTEFVIERQELGALFKAHTYIANEEDYKNYVHHIQNIVSGRTKSTMTFYDDQQSESMGHGPQEYVEPKYRALLAARMAIRIGSTPKGVFDAGDGVNIQVFNNFSEDEARAGDYSVAEKTVRLGLLNERDPGTGFAVFEHELLGHHLDALFCGQNWGEDKQIRTITGVKFTGDWFNTEQGADQVTELRVMKRYGSRDIFEHKATLVENVMGPLSFGLNEEGQRSKKIDNAQALLFGRIEKVLGSRAVEALAVLNDGSYEGYFGLHPHSLVERLGE